MSRPRRATGCGRDSLVTRSPRRAAAFHEDPLWFPQSFFARTLWMVLIVVLFSKVLTLVYLMTNEDVLVDRQYSHGAALTLRAYWAADTEDRDRIGRAAGLQLVAEQNVPRSEYHWPYTEIFQRQMRDELGDDTEVRVRIQPSTAIWVRAPSLGPDWVQVPLYAYPLRGQRIWSVLGWFLASACCPPVRRGSSSVSSTCRSSGWSSPLGRSARAAACACRSATRRAR